MNDSDYEYSKPNSPVLLLRKPFLSRSSPQLYLTKSEFNEKVKVKKNSATDTAKNEKNSLSVEYDIKIFIMNPPTTHKQPEIILSLLVLHAMIDVNVLKFIRKNTCVFMSNLRSSYKIEGLNLIYFLKAIHAHKKSKRILQEKRIGRVISFYSLFPENQKEHIDKLLSTKDDIKSIDSQYQSLYEHIINKSILNPDFLVIAFLSFGNDYVYNIDSFLRFVAINKKNDLLLDKRNQELGLQVMQLITLVLISRAQPAHEEVIEICQLLIIQYINTYSNLPPSILQSDDLHAVFKQFNTAFINSFFSTIKSKNLTNDYANAIILRLMDVKKLVFAKIFLIHPIYDIIFSDIATLKKSLVTKILILLMKIKSFEIDLLLLSKNELVDHFEISSEDPVFSVYLSKLIERIRKYFDFKRLVTDIADARSFAFGGSLSRESVLKLESLKSHLFLSFSEVKKAFLLEQALKRTEYKTQWLKIHGANMTILAKSLKPYISSHLKLTPKIHRNFKSFATIRLIRMDEDACNPENYKLDKLPEELSVIKSLLSHDDILEYNKNLGIMLDMFKTLGKYRTINISSDSMIGYISVDFLTKQILSKYPNCISGGMHHSTLNQMIADQIFDFLFAESNHPAEDGYLTKDTLENVKSKSEVLFIEAWKATDFLAEISSPLKTKTSKHSTIEVAELLLIIKDSCTKLMIKKTIDYLK